MNAQCSKCGTQLALAWDFCPHCGLVVSHEVQKVGPPPEHETTSVPGAFGGLYFGLIAVPILLVFGGMLCLTGLGAILGIPLIILAIISPLLGPLIGIGEHKGKCPSCGTQVISVGDGQNHCCPACNKEFALSDHHQVAKAG
jgi:hypothetical protein